MKNNTKQTQSMPESILSELYAIRNPGKLFNKRTFLSFKNDIKKIIRKNKNAPFHLPKDINIELATARNRNLITKKEQEILRKKIVGFFGMSVGSHAAISWLITSRADLVKIMDPDTIDATNLNRIRTGWRSVGRYKVDIVKEEMKSIHPFVKTIVSKNISDQNVEKFFNGKFPLDAVVDEIDDFDGKVSLRKLAQKRRIPLISAADVGDNIMVDVERHDTDIDYPFFHGIIKKSEYEKADPQEKKKLIIKLIGFEHNCEKMIDSISSIGVSIPTWPQLGSTAYMTGGIISALLKKIFLQESIKSGRYYISLDDIFVSDFHSPKRKIQREKRIQKLRKAFRI